MEEEDLVREVRLAPAAPARIPLSSVEKALFPEPDVVRALLLNSFYMLAHFFLFSACAPLHELHDL